VLLLTWSALVILGVCDQSPCLSNSFAPITTGILSQSLTSFHFPTNEPELMSVAYLVWSAQVPSTETQAALFFATHASGDNNKLFVRLRNCAVPDFGVASDPCVGRQDHIVEVFCPTCFTTDPASTHVYTFINGTLTPVTTVVPLHPGVYDNGGDAQFWFAFGSQGNTGWIQNSGIPELKANDTSDNVFVRAGAVAVTAAIRSASEPCSPSIDCKVGEWSSWSSCDSECDGGHQIRTRDQIVAARNGGVSCENLGELRSCNFDPCADGLSDKARAGIVIACIGSIIIAFLLFFAMSKKKPLFSKRVNKKLHAQTSQPSPQRHVSPPSQPQQPGKKASSDEGTTTTTPAAKTGQTWV